MSALQELDASPLGPVCIHKNRRLSQNVTINLQYTLSGKKKIWRESKFRNMYFCIQQANTVFTQPMHATVKNLGSVYRVVSVAHMYVEVMLKYHQVNKLYIISLFWCDTLDSKEKLSNLHRKKQNLMSYSCSIWFTLILYGICHIKAG